MDCLSRMRGNSHVRFLGEGSAARRSPYPTYDEGSIPFTRSNEKDAEASWSSLHNMHGAPQKNSSF